MEKWAQASYDLLDSGPSEARPDLLCWKSYPLPPGGGEGGGGGGNQDSGNRKPECRGWESMRMGGDNTGDGLASQPRCYGVPAQPLLNRHQVGGVSRSRDGLFAQ